MWRDYIEAILEGDFKPPYMVDLDPSNICNYDNCIWCNSKIFRHQQPMMLPTSHLLQLADFLKKWGVKSACISGGGEPLTNPGFAALLIRMRYNNLKTGVITNGSLINQDNGQAIVRCSSWCGISVDAATETTFNLVHGLNPKQHLYKKTIDNLRLLVDLKKQNQSNIEITYKFLLHPYNAKEILPAVRLARDIGCDTFHLRPVCWDNLYGQNHDDSINFTKHINSINIQIKKAQQLENNKFKFFGIRHKFNPDFSRKINFKKCLATPMMTTFGADGNVHLCFDVRGKPEWILCRHYPNVSEILDVWGTDKHKKIIEQIDPNKCPRCTFGPLNEIIEKVFIEDRMYKDFL